MKTYHFRAKDVINMTNHPLRRVFLRGKRHLRAYIAYFLYTAPQIGVKCVSNTEQKRPLIDPTSGG